MIRKLISTAAVLLLFVTMNLQVLAQGGLTSSVPSVEFSTEGGRKIITVYNVDASVSKGRVLKNNQPVEGFVITPGIQVQKRVPIFIEAEKTNIAFSGYTLELLTGNTWKPVPVTINVVRAMNKTLVLNPVIDNKKTNAAKSSLAMIDEAKNSPLSRPRLLLVKNRVNESIRKNIIATGALRPEITDWFPKDTGAIGGSFIVMGKQLDSVLHLSLGSEILPVTRRIKNGSFEAIIVQLPNQARAGTLSLTYPLIIGGRRTTAPMEINENYVLVDQFSSQWPAMSATIINITPSPDFADKPHALKEYTYTILYEYVPGNIVREYRWKHDRDLPGSLGDRSSFRPSSEVGMGISGEYSTGSGAPDASGGHFITGNMFVGSITGTIYSPYNFYRNNPARDVPVMTERINTEVSSYLNSNSQARDIRKSVASAAFDYNTPQKFVINNTYTIKDVFDFSLHYSHGTTEGISTGQADIRVGMMNIDNDLAFRICSGPLGTEAVWVGKPFMMSDGWRVTKFNWHERLVHPGSYAKAHAQPFNTLVLSELLLGNFMKNLEGCRNYDGVYKSVTNYPPYNYTSKDINYDRFTFEYDPERADESLTCNPYMRANPNEPRGRLDRQNIKGAFVNLKADMTATNDHRVTMVLESIELLGPRGANSNTAFNGIVRYEPLLNPSGGHIIGIVHPEFFRLLGDR